jgi:hypothetical protein
VVHTHRSIPSAWLRYAMRSVDDTLFGAVTFIQRTDSYAP